MDLDKIRTTDWYRQETESAPYFIYRPCCGCLYWFHDQDSNIFWLCRNDLAKAYFSKDLMRQLAEKYLLKEREDFGFIDNLYNDWYQKVRVASEKIFEEINKSGVKKFSDSALLRINHRLASANFFMWNLFYIDIYDLDAEGLVKKELIEENVVLEDAEIADLMSQEKLISHQRSERDLLKIVEDIKKTPGALNTFLYISSPQNLHRLKLYPEIEKAIENYQSSYFWIYNSWGHTQVLTAFEIVENIKQILSGPRDTHKELDMLVNFSKEIKDKKTKIFKYYHLSKWGKQMFHFFGVISFWRDERKVQVQRLNHYLELVGTEMARRSNLNWEDIKKCDPLAIKSLPVKRSLTKKYETLFKKSYMLAWNGKSEYHLNPALSSKLEKIIEKSIDSAVTEIRGVIACTGKAEGRVVVINKMSEFSKMSQGDVLVTVSTRPEFVPLMKNAVAIVTDEGGITSHAAVVSRELKIPCIIGTQAATKKLKDGDWVLVNADHGVVIVK
ncbi:MAG: hypothetical protein A3J93_04275 [Candidatus Magasanikbacteria bacterium RIFOXYC2_FULL_42_28]|uniref:PEP-utilising enzyme mobile domain-containing protein n=1 Tax=Candidatus Magasanikbacteria bacterium RIFOXYC2_FULL_42_28 TaxID=1798704 RepID=A0A1F6NX36_9BACT|nr:MAG: hypothetical protein A3J93_04275 [Candidatus Magasanikbacteria bacterium RIFOXYC2_FULL_42_28]